MNKELLLDKNITELNKIVFNLLISSQQETDFEFDFNEVIDYNTVNDETVLYHVTTENDTHLRQVIVYIETKRTSSFNETNKQVEYFDDDYVIIKELFFAKSDYQCKKKLSSRIVYETLIDDRFE